MEYLIKFGNNPPVDAVVKSVGSALNVAYTLNGVGYLLKIEKGKLTHKTLGDGLDAEFIQGKSTVGKIKCGSAVAPYEVFCKSLNVKTVGLGREITVVFDDGDEVKKVEITLYIGGGKA